MEFSEEQSWILDMVNNILIEVLGRPQIQFPENWQCVMEQVKNKEITSVTAMKILDMKKTTYYKLRKMSDCGRMGRLENA